MAGRVEQPRDQLRVVRRTAHQLACADAVVEARVEFQGTGEERVANGGVGVRAVADREEVAHPARARLDQPEQHEPAAPEQERLVVLGDDPAVDRTLDDERRHDRRPLPDEPSCDRAEHSPALAHDQAPEIAPGGASSLGLVLLHRADSARTCEAGPRSRSAFRDRP